MLLMFRSLTSVTTLPSRLLSSRNIGPYFSKMSKSFLVTKNMSEQYFERLLPKYSMDMWEHSKDISRDDLLKRVKGKSAIFCTLVDKIDAVLLDAAGPKLKSIYLCQVSQH